MGVPRSSSPGYTWRVAAPPTPAPSRALRSWGRVVACATALLWSLPAGAAPFDPSGSDWEGCARLVELAREELGAARVLVVEEVDYERLGPTDGVLLIHPEGSYDLDELSTFMRLGGRVAVVDDFGDGDRLLDRFRIARGPAPVDPLQMLRGNPQLPIAIPASGHPIVADVAQVVLNHPTTVKHGELSSLLRIPRIGGELGPDVALAGQVGEGRLVAVGDPSVFINQMLRFPGNRALARNLVAYLLEGAGERRRDAKLTVLHGRFRERGSLGGGIRGTLRDRARGLLGAVDGVRRGGFGGPAARIVALGIVVAAAIWTALRAGSRAAIPRPRFAAADPELAFLARGADDPRIASLFERVGRFRPRFAVAPGGVQLLKEAVDSAIAARDDLAGLARAEAARGLAASAGLSAREVAGFVAAYERLSSVVIGAEGSGPRAWKATRREIAWFGRVLSPVADSLRGTR
jgi:hypothetical protein